MNDVKLVIDIVTGQAQAAMKSFEANTTRSVKAVESSFAGVQKQLTGFKDKILGIGAAYLSFQSIKAAINQIGEFSKAIQEVKSISDDSIRSNKNLESELLAVARQFGKAPVEQVKTFYQIISAGITDAATAQNVLVASNKLAIGGLSSVTSAVDILTSALNVYAESNLDAEVAADALFTGVKLGKTTISELSGSLGQVLPVASALKISMQDVTAAVATLTTKGLATSEAVTSLKSLFNGLLRAQNDLSKQSPEVAAAFDLNALKTKRFDKFIKDLNDSVGGSDAKLLTLLGRSEALLAVQNLASNSTKALSNSLDVMADSAGAAQRAFEDVEKSVGAQLERLQNNLSNLILTFTIKGEGALTTTLEYINKLLESFTKFVDSGDTRNLPVLLRVIIDSFKDVTKVVIIAALAIDKFASTLDKYDTSAKKSASTSKTGEKGFLSWSNAADFFGKSVVQTFGFGVPLAISDAVNSIDKAKAAADKAGNGVKKTANEVGGLDAAILSLANKDTVLGAFARSFIASEQAAKKAAEATRNIGEEAKEAVEKIEKDFTIGDFFSLFTVENAKAFTSSLTEGAKSAGNSFKSAFSVDGLKGIVDKISNISFAEIFAALKEAGAYVYDGIVKSAKVFSFIFGGDLVNSMGQGLQILVGLPEQFLKSVQEFGKLLDSLIEGLSTAITDLPRIFDDVFSKFIARFPQLVRSAVDAISVIAGKIAEAAPALLDVVLQGLTIFVQGLPKIVKKLAEAIGPALRSFLTGLPDLITVIFDTIPEIAKILADQVGPLVEEFASKADVIVLALIEGLVGASGEIVAALIDSLLIEGGLERIVVALIKAAPRVALATVEGIVNGLGRAAGAIGDSLAYGLSSAAANIGKNIGINASKNLFIQKPNFSVAVKKPDFKLDVNKPKLSIPRPGWVDELISALNKLKIGGGSGGGKSASKFLGLASGGYVPKGYPDDTFPASLTSGELVTPPRTTENLFSLIDSLSQKINEPTPVSSRSVDQNLTINLQVGESELAKVLLNLNRQGFRTAV